MLTRGSDDTRGVGTATRLDTAVSDLRRERPVLVRVDDTGAEMVFAAEFATPGLVNLLVRRAGGLVCLCLPPDEARRLDLRPIDRRGERAWIPAFTVSIEARVGITTGISAMDRALTISTAADPASSPGDLVHPGHVSPIVADPRELSARRALPEAAVTLMDLAGLRPLAVTCAVLDHGGEVADGDAVMALAQNLDLAVVEVDEIVRAQARR